MKTYSCGQCVSESVAGCVRIEARFASDEQVLITFSPAGARYLARNLVRSADDAEKWQAPDLDADTADPEPPHAGEEAAAQINRSERRSRARSSE